MGPFMWITVLFPLFKYVLGASPEHTTQFTTNWQFSVQAVCHWNPYQEAEACYEAHICYLGFKREDADSGKLKKKDVVVIILGLWFLISVVIIIYLTGVMTKSPHDLCPRTSCLSKWVGYEGRCYYFSDAEGTWNHSKSNCSAFGAFLAPIENQKEMVFIMRYMERTDYWIGLKRKEGQPWKWANGSIFNGWFKIGVDGFCAYLNDEKASSTWCDTQRNWICSKSAHMA